MTAYYNEIDPYAAQWIRNLMAAGHVAPGVVDERSIEDVQPDDLREFAQVHMFAGIAVWSYALRQAGWPDDRQVWTGSCPCQPFSAAGKGAGFNDERHLWPHFQWLIQQCQPATVFGEQVASKAVSPWIDLIHADLEAMDYAFGCVPFPSAGVGAPHVRDRTYWVAHANASGRVKSLQSLPGKTPERPRRGGDLVVGMGDTNGTRSQKHGESGNLHIRKPDRTGEGRLNLDAGLSSGLADTDKHGRIEGGVTATTARQGNTTDTDGGFGRPGPTNRVWRDVDWLFCRDGKWRCVESGTFPLAHGAPSRVGRLRAYGNAINAYQAQVFIESAIKGLEQ